MKLTVPMLVVAVGLATGSKAFSQGSAASASSANPRHSTTVLSDGTHEVRVNSDGDSATVTLDGKLVASLSLSGDWTSHKVVDADGNVVATVWRSDTGAISAALGDHDEPQQQRNWSAQMWRERGTDWAARLGQLADSDELRNELRSARGKMAEAIALARTEMPKVMIGITMSDTDETTVGTLGYEADNTTTIESVIEDGPAAKAGLQDGDIIVAFDGKPAADFAAIRDALKTHEPGDVVTVSYLRDGAKADTTITLEPYSPQAFGMNFFTQDSPGSQLLQRFNLSDQDMERIQSEIAELSAKLQQLSAELASAVGARAQELGQLSAQLGQEIAAKASDLARRSAAERSVCARCNGRRGATAISA